MNNANRPTPTPNGVACAINSFLNSVAPTIAYLYERWNDEREYEDFASYADALRAATIDGFKFLRATKRPFGFTFTANDFPGARYAMFATRHNIGWKRVA